MNNQAAQTMPELPRPTVHWPEALPLKDGGAVLPATYYTADQMHQYARDYAAALSQPAGVDLEQFRDVVNHYLSYYRGSLRLAEDSLSPITCGVNDLFQRRIDKATRLLALIDARAAAPAASGVDTSTNEAWASRAQEKIAAMDAGASVSERARAMLAAEFDGIGMHGVANDVRMNKLAVIDKAIIRALEQALTQQRGESTQDPPAMDEADGREPEDWRIGWALAYTGWALYTDDGELQDNREAPFIDFRRDDAALIRKKIAQRAKNHGRYIESATHDGGTNPKPQAAVGGVSEPYDECYSLDGDSWVDSPADSIFVDGLSVGDTYKVVVSHYSIERTYMVTKAPDETSDDYEVRPIEATTPQPGAEALRELVRRAIAALTTHGQHDWALSDPTLVEELTAIMEERTDG